MSEVKCVLIHDNFQNFKSYSIPRAQLVIADIPYNIGGDFFASRPDWYVDGDNQNGESSKAHKAAFHTDYTFNIAEYFAFCNRLLKKEPSNGSYNKLQDAGAAYAANQPEHSDDDTNEPEEQDTPEEETDDRFLRKKRRKKVRNGGM